MSTLEPLRIRKPPSTTRESWHIPVAKPPKKYQPPLYPKMNVPRYIPNGVATIGQPRKQVNLRNLYKSSKTTRRNRKTRRTRKNR
jgi:hypothetical protein